MHYTHPVGRYTLTRTSRVVSGLEAAPTLAQTGYVGVPEDFLRKVQSGDSGRAAGQSR
ncbi:hypothetical protein [Allokutzneria albata]|uniref:Uncharacterized protein n=1 Tax=Allokutzneria albata TaxID=211114 RepID=A0A1H0AAX4_ALLAB|nr:hypothetical protein [Allokutzneria albata]SDN30424.1 hypothetical protein SAMN04489726_5963 [Allokutzneria albata]